MNTEALFSLISAIALVGILLGIFALFLQVRSARREVDGPLFGFWMRKRPDDRGGLLELLDSRISQLSLILEDPVVQERFEKLLEIEIDFFEYIDDLGEKEVPLEKPKTFGQKVTEKIGGSWKDWVKRIFKKLNSMLGSIIPTGGNRISSDLRPVR